MVFKKPVIPQGITGFFRDSAMLPPPNFMVIPKRTGRY